MNVNTDRDDSEPLLEAVRSSVATGDAVEISGSGSKAHLTGQAPAAKVSTLAHRGIVDYQPEELVVTVRAGTLLTDLSRVLFEHGQHLPFDPPVYNGSGTVGGAIACGLSGPGRPWLGSVRDCLLGVVMINGLGERLRFGGQVMKNVAGYDVSRLQAGAWGTLGVLLEVSLKLLPRPTRQATRALEMNAADALSKCRELTRRPYPVSATCWSGGSLYIRLSGAEPAVQRAATDIGGTEATPPAWWQRLRDQEHPLFNRVAAPWRVVVPPATPLNGDCLVEWAGALRWYEGEKDAATVTRHAAEAGGFAHRFDSTFAGSRLKGGDPVQQRYHQRLRAAFDPQGLFNPHLGCGYAH